MDIVVTCTLTRRMIKSVRFLCACNDQRLKKSKTRGERKKINARVLQIRLTNYTHSAALLYSTSLIATRWSVQTPRSFLLILRARARVCVGVMAFLECLCHDVRSEMSTCHCSSLQHGVISSTAQSNPNGKKLKNNFKHFVFKSIECRNFILAEQLVMDKYLIILKKSKHIII